LQNRFELQKLLKEVLGEPEQQAVNYAVLRSLQRAVYSPEEEGHYALASDCYCHFTSPIRRYPDLTIHRLLELLLRGGKPRNDFSELAVLGEHCSEREQQAEEAERELTKVKLLNYLSGRIGEEMDAVITGVEQYGLFAQGIELPAEGLIHVTSLADDFYQYDRPSHTLSGRRSENQFRLGDRVRVVVARVDVDRRELDFRLVERRGRHADDGAASRHLGTSAPQPAGRSHGDRVDDLRPKKQRGKSDGAKKGKKRRRE
jgi:ribonuclease R